MADTRPVVTTAKGLIGEAGLIGHAGPIRVAVLARSVHPLHGLGGLERHVYDLVRHLIAQDVHVTLITKPPTAHPPGATHAPRATLGDATSTVTAERAPAAGDSTPRDSTSMGPTMAGPAAAAGHATSADTTSAGSAARPSGEAEMSTVPNAADWFGVPRDRFRLITVPYLTFPGAGRRGTTVADRATAYPLFGWRVGRVAVKLVRRGEIDIVHALGASGLGYAWARRRHEHTVPFVFNPQGLEEFGATDPRRARLKRAAYAPLQVAVRSCAKAADLVLATDRALVPTVLHHLPIDAVRVAVVPNALDLDTLDRARARVIETGATAAMRARHGLAHDTPVLLSVGRLEENKGYHVLARALGELLRRETAAGVGGAPANASSRATAGGTPPSSRDWRWVLVGDGPYRSTIERVAAAEGLASRMIVAGRASDDELHAWYETATLFVHPTLYEGSSLVTLEAMAHERAVVATRAGGLPDKVYPGVNGWLIEPDRADLLADALAQALSAGPDHLARLGRAGRDLVLRDFAWPVVATRLIEWYRRLLGARGAVGERTGMA